MTYHYEVRTPFHVADGPDDFRIELAVEEFQNMGNAKNYAGIHPGSRLLLVMSDGDYADITEKAGLSYVS